MGILGSVCFFIQSLIQFSIGLICIKSSKNQQFYKALKFASANGLQQLTQAICYIIGYWLTKQGYIEEPLVIHKIIQTLLQSSMMIPNASSYVQEVKKSKTAYKKICPYLVAETEDK
uniref:Transmembrane protein n=1 Tax=Acrobeloides nanus TaxID=290746 RepID=A0A914DC07_9BILA